MYYCHILVCISNDKSITKISSLSVPEISLTGRKSSANCRAVEWLVLGFAELTLGDAGRFSLSSFGSLLGDMTSF